MEHGKRSENGRHAEEGDAEATPDQHRDPGLEGRAADLAVLLVDLLEREVVRCSSHLCIDRRMEGPT